MRRLSIAIAWFAAGAASAAPLVPPLLDWQADSAQAAREGRPLVLFFSMPDCGYCATVRQNYLAPLLRAPGAARPIIREAGLTSEERIAGIDGASTTARQVARRYGVKAAPTLVFVDGRGRPLAGAIVGGDMAGMYGAYLDNALEESARLLASQASSSPTGSGRAK